MGVKKLTKELANIGREVDLASFLCLLVDGAALRPYLLSLCGTATPDNPFPLLTADVQLHGDVSIVAFVLCMRSVKCELRLCFDGSTCWSDAKSKEQTRADRFAQSLEGTASIQTYLECGELPLRAKNVSFEEAVSSLGTPFLGASESQTLVLRKLGVQMVSALGEADAALAYLLSHQYPAAAGILSEDSDFAIFPGARYCPLSSLRIGAGLWAACLQLAHKIVKGEVPCSASVPTDQLGTGDDWSVSCKVIEQVEVAAALGIQARLMPDLACLSGNDWTATALQQHAGDLMKVVPAGTTEAGPVRVASWLQGQLCACEAPAQSHPELSEGRDGICSACGKPERLVNHVGFSRVLMDCPSLSSSFAYSLSMYEGHTRGIGIAGDWVLAAVLGRTLEDGVPVQFKEFKRALERDPWLAAAYAADWLDLCPVSPLLLEHPVVRVFDTVAEPLAFHHRQANTALITRPWRAIDMLFAQGLEEGARSLAGIVEMVGAGAVLGLVKVLPHPRNIVREAVQGMAQVLAANGLSIPRLPITLVGNLVSLLPLADRARLFHRASSLPFVEWCPQWCVEPVDLPMGVDASEISMDTAPCAYDTELRSIGSPWLRDDFDPASSSFDPVHAVLALPPATLAAWDVRSLTTTVTVLVPTLRHLLAMSSLVPHTEDAGYPDYLPTLQELAVLTVSVLLLQGTDKEREAHLRAAPRVHGRPLLRHTALAGWYYKTCTSIVDLAVSCGIMAAPPSFPHLGIHTQEGYISAAVRDNLVRVAAQANKEGVHIMHALHQAKVEMQSCPASPAPSQLYSGALFHALIEDCNEHGAPCVEEAGCSPSLTSSSSNADIDPLSLLPVKALSLLQAYGRTALDLYATVMGVVLAPFKQRHVLLWAQLRMRSAAPQVQIPSSGSMSASAQAAAQVQSGEDLELTFLSAAVATMDLSEPAAGKGRKPESDVGKKKAAVPKAVQAPSATINSSSAPPLPIHAFRSQIVWSIGTHTVTLVKADTGSGKSSQVPQYILETSLHASASSQGQASAATVPSVPVPHEVWGSASPSVYVTQPRRLAAVTLAKRVASERGEAIGNTIGYRIGQDAMCSTKTRVTFVTTGWLLTWLVHSAQERSRDADYEGDALDVPTDIAGGRSGRVPVTHILLDETHERGIDTDLTLLVCKMAIVKGLGARARAVRQLQAMAVGQARREDMERIARAAWSLYSNRTRIVLMSATIDTGVFTDYLEDIVRQAARSIMQQGVNAAEEAVMRYQIPRLLDGCPPSVYQDAPPSQHAPDSLLGSIERDRPTTLYVGTKRYPVDICWMSEVYKHPTLKTISKAEATAIAGVQQKMDRSAQAWAANRKPGQAGRDVAEAVNLSDKDRLALYSLAARIALTCSQTGTGDCILIFVAGMLDIDTVCDTIIELAPSMGHVVNPPTAKLAIGEEVEEDTDMRAQQERADRAQRGAAQSLTAEDGADVDSGIVDRDDEGGSQPEVRVQDKSTIRLLPMHSLIRFDDQLQAFDADSGDMRTRVVIATNIAETSVTLPEVHTVIDMGRAKQMEFSSRLQTSLLRATWISQSSAAQRSGRAGRVRPGTCYRLYTQSFHNECMPKYDQPEMLRLSLDTVVLKVKLLGLREDQISGALGVDAWGDGEEQVAEESDPTSASAKAILGNCIQAPEMSNVDVALSKLAALGALESSDDRAKLTPLGHALASFPGNLDTGKMISFGILLGAVPDAIVLAAALGSQDVFLMPHSAMANDSYEYASVCTKVTRSRWLFGRDPTLAPHLSGQASQSWSDPITTRNAYIAWRMIDRKAQSGWCAGMGIMHRRMLGLHSLVREIGQRVSNDQPSLAPLVRGMMGGDGYRTETGDKEFAALFTSNSQLLRILLCSSHLSTLCVGSPVAAGSVRMVRDLGLEPSRTINLTLDAAAVPLDWITTLPTGIWRPQDPGAAKTPEKAGGGGGASGRAPSEPIALLRSLADLGITRQAIVQMAVVPPAGGGKGKKSKGGSCTVWIEFRPDWSDEARAALMTRKPTWDRHVTASPGKAFGSPIPAGIHGTLGLTNDEGGSDVLPASCLKPLGSCFPLHVQVIATLARTRQTLVLPYVPPDKAQEEEEVKKTGVRKLVPGAVFVDDGSKGSSKNSRAPASLPGLSSPAPGDSAGSSSRPALPASVAQELQLQHGSPVELRANTPGAVTWSTNAASSGYGVFGVRASDGEVEQDGPGQRGAGPKKYAARVPQHSTIRLMQADTGTGGEHAGDDDEDDDLEGDSDEEEILYGRKGGKGRKGKGGGSGRAGTGTQQASTTGPMLAVCAMHQIQESFTNGVKRYAASMSGVTVLWRDPSTTALALLLFGRGITASLAWQVEERGRPYVSRVIIDPSGSDPLLFNQCYIPCECLLEVNALRSQWSEVLSHTALEDGVKVAAQTQQRVLTLLGFGSTSVPSMPGLSYSSLPVRPVQCTVYDIAPIDQGMGGAEGGWRVSLGLEQAQQSMESASVPGSTLLAPYKVFNNEGDCVFGCPGAELEGQAVVRGPPVQRSRAAGRTLRPKPKQTVVVEPPAETKKKKKEKVLLPSSVAAVSPGSAFAGSASASAAPAHASLDLEVAEAALSRAKHALKAAQKLREERRADEAEKQANVLSADDELQSGTQKWAKARRAYTDAQDASAAAHTELTLPMQQAKVLLVPRYLKVVLLRSASKLSKHQASLATLLMQQSSMDVDVAQAEHAAATASVALCKAAAMLKKAKGEAAQEKAQQAVAEAELGRVRAMDKVAAATAARTSGMTECAAAIRQAEERIKKEQERCKMKQSLVKASEDSLSAVEKAASPAEAAKLMDAVAATGVDVGELIHLAIIP